MARFTFEHRARRGSFITLTAGTVGLAMLGAACAPAPDPGPITSTTEVTTTTQAATTTTTPLPSGPTEVSGVQLNWAYSGYAQQGVFARWSQVVSGSNVQVNTVDGYSVTGLETDQGYPFLQGQFDGGTGTIDLSTGEGTISWDTGDWVLNAYNGQYGAPDETLRDPILEIAPDGSGTLSFEAYLPPALDMNGEPSAAAGPIRVTVADFSSVQVTEDGLRVIPTFSGRAYTPPSGLSGWMSCEGAGGSWPTEWIDFLPDSVKAHYYSTSCSGLNATKAPLPFTAQWTTSAPAVTYQPVLTESAINAGDKLAPLGAMIGVAGTPTPTVQWQSSLDGTTWTDIAGATSTRLETRIAPELDGTTIRAVVAGSIVSDIIGPIDVTATAPVLQNFSAESTAIVPGNRTKLTAVIHGAPQPTVTFELSTDGGATWQVAPPTYIQSDELSSGRIRSTLTTPVLTTADTGIRYRVRYSNGTGTPLEQVSNVVSVTVSNDVPVFTSQTRSVELFEGQAGATLNAAAIGLPAPTYQWQTSHDGGITWNDLGTSSGAAARAIPTSEVVLANDAMLYRVAATNTAGTTYSSAIPLTVWALNGDKQVRIVETDPINPNQGTTITVVGAGFTPPEDTTGNMRLVMTDTTTWQPGQDGVSTGFLASVNLTRTSLVSAGGYFRRTLTIPANVWVAGRSYGVATFGATATQRWYDTWSPVEVVVPGA